MVIIMNENSIITQIFYKKDALTGDLRISKTIVISLIVFILMFLFFLIFGPYYEFGYILPEDIIISIIIALVLTLPVFIIGWIISYFIDKNAYKSKVMNEQIENRKPAVEPTTSKTVIKDNTMEKPTIDDAKMSDSQINDYIIKIANTHDPFTVDGEYECQREYDLLKAEGNNVIHKIEHYLKSFAMNLGPSLGCETWYYGGKNLVRLLGDISTPESLDIVAGLFSIESNIAEWYWEILSQAAIVLGDKGNEKYIDTLNNALNHNMAPKDQIIQAIGKISSKSASDMNQTPVASPVEDSIVEESKVVSSFKKYV